MRSLLAIVLVLPAVGTRSRFYPKTLQGSGGRVLLQLKSSSKVGNSNILNGTLADGTQVLCLDCNVKLFSLWVQQASKGCGKLDTDEGDSLSDDVVSKHPNAPGYDAWARQQGEQKEATSFLSLRAQVEKRHVQESRPSLSSSSESCGTVTSVYTQDWDLEAMRPMLKELWAKRRLIMGPRAPPLHENLDLAHVLQHIALKSPNMVISQECSSSPDPARKCGVLFDGQRQVATSQQLQAALQENFSPELLGAARYDSDASGDELRRRVKKVLMALKKSYAFYKQGCILSADSSATCNMKAASDLVGRIGCSEQDIKSKADCVHSELRKCKSCESADGEKKPQFFEYSRLHGPLALFQTAQTRNSIMGQCEEFSRAGYAVLSFLGYKARYILDFTDHVWLEVQLPGADGEAQWVHADPSEGVLDNPLMYEKGWGKKLTMVFAFTPSGVEHVTRRYTAHYGQTVIRRRIRESALQSTLDEVNAKLSEMVPQSEDTPAELKALQEESFDFLGLSLFDAAVVG